MVLNRSSYMFLLKPGNRYQFEIEACFFNTTSRGIEPISASSKSTPREKKLSFGPIEKFRKVDEEVIEIVNKKEDAVQLLVSKLSPRLDHEDSMLKNTILTLLDKGTDALVNALNAVVDKFHAEECRKMGDADDEEVFSQGEVSPLDESISRCSSLSLLRKNSGKRCSNQMSSAGSMYSCVKRGKKTNVDESHEILEGEESVEDKDERESKLDNDVNGLKEGEAVDRERDPDHKVKEDETDGEALDRDPVAEEDFTGRISDVVAEARFMPICIEDCEVSNALLINRDIVAKLKDALMQHPDKCQCIIGVIRVVDNMDDKNKVGKFHVFVNSELFIAIQELSFEGADFYGKNKVPAVVHTILEGEVLTCETLGIFLQKNSKTFSEQMRESMNYQDLLRFSCLTVFNQGSGEDVKHFIKQSLKNFGKGKQNSSLFIEFAMLPESYLNKFEMFTRLFESGSLMGQKLSGRKLCNVDKNRNSRVKNSKLEVPLNLLKLHMSVPHTTREKLLDDLLNHQLDFTKYCATLKTSSEISNVKKNVEKVAKTTFSDLKEESPELFSDFNLKKFVGAKITPSGPNDVYKRLVKHVELAQSKQNEQQAAVELPHQACAEMDDLNILTLGRRMKGFQMMIFAMGKDESFNQNCLMCTVDQVIDDKECCGVIINSHDKNLRDDLKARFEGTGIVFEFIYVKRENVVVSNGFKKQLDEVAVFGNPEFFENKHIQTFYNCCVKEAISSIITDIVDIKSSVLYAFSEPGQGIELDPLGTLGRKQICVQYMALRNLLEPVQERINKKIG